jgi:hypothetical protein
MEQKIKKWHQHYLDENLASTVSDVLVAALMTFSTLNLYYLLTGSLKK